MQYVYEQELQVTYMGIFHTTILQWYGRLVPDRVTALGWLKKERRCEKISEQ